jgi:hypothetical protein
MEPCLGELATRTQLLTRFKTALGQLCAPEELATERLSKMVPILESAVHLKIARKRPDHPPARPESLDNKGRVGKRKQPESLEIQDQYVPVYVAPSQQVRSESSDVVFSNRTASIIKNPTTTARPTY